MKNILMVLKQTYLIFWIIISKMYMYYKIHIYLIIFY